MTYCAPSSTFIEEPSAAFTDRLGAAAKAGLEEVFGRRVEGDSVRWPGEAMALVVAASASASTATATATASAAASAAAAAATTTAAAATTAAASAASAATAERPAR